MKQFVPVINKIAKIRNKLNFFFFFLLFNLHFTICPAGHLVNLNI